MIKVKTAQRRVFAYPGEEVKPNHDTKLRLQGTTTGTLETGRMARQADGKPWEDDGTHPGAPEAQSRQPFLPSGYRLFEEIDRFGLGHDGLSSILTSAADYDFIRVAPSAGYKKGLPAALRNDFGEGDIEPEQIGRAHV